MGHDLIEYSKRAEFEAGLEYHLFGFDVRPQLPAGFEVDGVPAQVLAILSCFLAFFLSYLPPSGGHKKI